MTGAKVEVAEMPFAELFQKVQTDWTTGTNSVDVGVVTAGWVVELAAAGLVEDLTPYVEKDTKLDLQDIAPYFRENNQKIQGKTIGLTIDGDFQMVYYRKDVLDAAGLQPPKTWEEMVSAAQKLTNPAKKQWGMALAAGSYTENVHFAFITAEQNGSLVGYACYGPIAGTKSSYDLYWIAVHPELQGRGLGQRTPGPAQRAPGQSLGLLQRCPRRVGRADPLEHQPPHRGQPGQVRRAVTPLGARLVAGRPDPVTAGPGAQRAGRDADPAGDRGHPETDAGRTRGGRSGRRRLGHPAIVPCRVPECGRGREDEERVPTIAAK